MTDIIKICDVVECEECPRYADDCDGNKDELHFCFSCGAKMEGGAE